MKIFIRADASIKIGTGHVVRCMTLAHELKNRGAKVTFITRAHKGNLDDKIKLNGFDLISLPMDEKQTSRFDSSESYDSWLGADIDDEISQASEVIQGNKVDLLIVDHYSLDEKWESAIRPYVKIIMVIDDLANRKHDCDILLDQTYGRELEDYLELTPPDCEFLLGAEYALLRPEFFKWREYSLKRRINPKLEKVLITMGGVDSDNYTKRILDTLENHQEVQKLSFTVVLGSSAPYLNMIQKMAKSLSLRVKVLNNVSNMAELMARSDLVIGASGATSWERCCLGVPSFVFATASNQNLILKGLEKEKAVYHIKKIEDLRDAFEKINTSEMFEMSEAASRLVDGRGTARVREKII